MKALLFTFLVLLSIPAFSQPAIQYQKVLGGTVANYQNNTVDTTLDGGYITGGILGYGVSLTNINAYTYGFLTKFNASGGLVWTKKYDAFRNDTSGAVNGYGQINCVKHTADGGFIAVGSTLKPIYGGTDVDLWVVIKTDSNGDTLWQRNFSVDTGAIYNQGVIPGGIAYCVMQTTDGDYVIAGYSVEPFGDEDFDVMKLNASGNVIWQKKYGGAGFEEAHSIVQSSDGNYVICGFTEGSSSTDGGDVSGNHGGYDYWVIKTDTSGNLVWQKCLGGSAADAGYSIANTVDGGSIVSGYSRSAEGDLTNNKGSGDFWIVKLTAAGNITWQKNFGGSGYDAGYGVTASADGTYGVTGTTNSGDGDVTNYQGSSDAWILKLDASGNLLFQKDIGSANTESGRAIIATKTGYVFTGPNLSRNIRSVPTNSPYYSSDNWLASVDNTGNLQWQTITGASGGYNVGISVVQATDGGFVTAGYGNSDNDDVSGLHGGYDGVLLKTDNTGALQWSKLIGGLKDDFANSIKKTTDGGYIVAGATASSDGDVTSNKGSFDFWVVKLTASGAISWQKTYGGSLIDSATSVQQTTDGGYIVAGCTTSNDGDVSGNHGGYDFWVIKLDASGNLTWQKTYGGTGDDKALAIQQTLDGGYIAGGYSTSADGNATANKGLTDYWVIKLDASGNLTWQKSYGGSSDDYCNTLYQTSDGKYIASGTTTSTDGDVTGLHGPYKSNDIWTIKLDASGNLIWEKTYGSDGFEWAYNIIQSSDGNYVTVGGSFFQISHEDSGDVKHGDRGYGDVWVTKTDTSGNIIWEQTYGGTQADIGFSIIQSQDGGYFLAGQTQSSDDEVTNPYGSFDYNIWTVKLADDVLPVTLLNFDGVIKDNSALLTWQTSSEQNNKGFEVQRSNDGNHFSNLGFVNGAGTSSQIHDYTYKDVKVVNGNNYYRLQQTDIDGRSTYSNVIKLDYSKFAFSILGNPLVSNSAIELQLDRNDHVSVQLFSINGILLKTIYKGVLEPGTYSLPLNADNLPAGTYTVKLIVGTRYYANKIVKQ